MGKRIKGMEIVISSIVYATAIICILPLFMMILYSLKNSSGGTWSLLQYARVLLQTPDFFQGFWNSVLYTGVTLAFNIPISLLAAYGFSFFKWNGRKTLFWLYIVLMLLPFQATIVAQYIILKQLKLLGRPMAVILPNIFATFGTVLAAQNMRGESQDTLEAGRIDGCNEFVLFIRIVLPAMRPVVTSLMLLTFISSWSMVEQPLVFLEDPALMPLSVSLQSNARFRPIAFASGTLFSVLPILLYQFAYDDLVLGIRLGAPAKRVESKEVQERLMRHRQLIFGEQKEVLSRKQKMFKATLFFFILMMVFTLMTQKIEHLMMPTVEAVHANSAELKLDPADPESESLGFYHKVLPIQCLHDEGGRPAVYILAEEKSARRRMEVLRVDVKVEKQNAKYVALTGAFTYEDQVVQYSSRPLQPGIFVRVVEE